MMQTVRSAPIRLSLPGSAAYSSSVPVDPGPRISTVALGFAAAEGAAMTATSTRTASTIFRTHDLLHGQSGPWVVVGCGCSRRAS